MGQRSFLYLNNTQREVFLFESNNSLPFFWLLLTDPATLEYRIQGWQAFQQFAQDHDEAETDAYLQQHTNSMVLSPAMFTQNAARGRAFLHRHFPHALPLFDAFADSITTRLATGDHIEIDITQFSAFYDTTDAFYEALRAEVAAIAADKPVALQFMMPDDLVGGGSGFEGSDNKAFAALPGYRDALQRRTAPVQAPVYKSHKKSRIVYIILLLLCPFFSFLVYKMYLKEGLSVQVILTALLNIGFYLFSAWSLIADIKAASRARK
ncbi:hypothetical protein [Taibaiella chishuiensis]|uniref:Uncharacterized protein n=1 Tax=Taibaiella chishuiensis TaxID=1434707 RepID=A0A2P8CZL2_9BACT|nr:hypothetical protein [Taibaiella chishuiensis]PSK90405.1 hypothetical protein B0I18_108135 [Taibaiella chishuiensis]